MNSLFPNCLKAFLIALTDGSPPHSSISIIANLFFEVYYPAGAIPRSGFKIPSPLFLGLALSM
jgi:hypothetical protein